LGALRFYCSADIDEVSESETPGIYINDEMDYTSSTSMVHRLTLFCFALGAATSLSLGAFGTGWSRIIRDEADHVTLQAHQWHRTARASSWHVKLAGYQAARYQKLAEIVVQSSLK
jgi:hypothetical protein